MDIVQEKINALNSQLIANYEETIENLYSQIDISDKIIKSQDEVILKMKESMEIYKHQIDILSEAMLYFNLGENLVNEILNKSKEAAEFFVKNGGNNG